ncbi:uncharacterized protein LOC126656194 [Mercurialis annua]|uniref:uncharacterized protein LOC126656194 n=1 Tax=Mercurialis annua TaxID=3986 RepID=UPI0021605B65|nr:uncharacterized protein LOC126656194 [Mercurialis annua]
MSGYQNKPRKVKLQCPSLSKIVSFTALDEQKLDLGSIARAFGLDPSTLKLNGHFISRGVDLVSSSVTWKSLLNFFSSKRLPTGQDDMDALIVDGKFCKAGSKRACNSQDAGISRYNYRAEPDEVSIRSISEPEEINLFMNKKLKEKHSGSGADHQVSKSAGLGFKRKQLLEVVNLLKKLKTNGPNPELGDKSNDCHRLTSSSKLKCSYSGGVKRMREDEAILAAPCKRIR